MVLPELVEEYIAYKQSLGASFKNASVRLRAFMAQVGEIRIEEVTAKQVRCFLDGRHGPTSLYWFSKHNSLNTFFRYARERGYLKHCPMPKAMPRKPAPSTPYIYSVDEVKQLLDAADSRHQDDWLLEPHTVRTLILLLYGTGLRISEATRLKFDDADLEEQILTIRETKFCKSRLVPVGDDLAQALRQYQHSQWASWETTDKSTFLSCRQRQPIKHQTARLVFKRLREATEITRDDGAKFQPRLHDFRHTFAVTRLVTWYREGKNVQRLLPHLSTYLGHARLGDTSRYLKMTKELMQEASQCFERYSLTETPDD
ncbi:MAG: tyrosine-type recombinase/integrase [Planctomycetaceae bacterium]